LIWNTNININRDVYVVTTHSIQLFEFQSNNQEKLIFDRPILNQLNELFIPPKDQSEIKEKYNPDVKIIDCDITRFIKQFIIIILYYLIIITLFIYLFIFSFFF